MKRKNVAEGYFTVEASMVLPMVCIVVLLIVYLWFFQYNRCLIEQDMGALALRGVAMQADDNEERMDNLRDEADSLYAEKYIAWDRGEIALTIGHGVVRTEQTGRMRILFGNIMGVEDMAQATALYENRLLSPVSFVRNVRKVIGGK